MPLRLCISLFIGRGVLDDHTYAGEEYADSNAGVRVRALKHPLDDLRWRCLRRGNGDACAAARLPSLRLPPWPWEASVSACVLALQQRRSRCPFGAFPATYWQDVLIMETSVVLPAVFVLVCVAPVGSIQAQLSIPLLVPGPGPLVLSPIILVGRVAFYTTTGSEHA